MTTDPGYHLDTLTEALEAVDCPTCNAGGYTVRVSHPDTGRFSMYACDACAPERLAIARREHPTAEVYPLPPRHVDLAVADQVETLLSPVRVKPTSDPGVHLVLRGRDTIGRLYHEPDPDRWFARWADGGAGPFPEQAGALDAVARGAPDPIED